MYVPTNYRILLSPDVQSILAGGRGSALSLCKLHSSIGAMDKDNMNELYHAITEGGEYITLTSRELSLISGNIV